MQLVITLLVAVAVLTILAGISTLFGSKKKNKANAVWLFIVTLGLALWSFSIAMFLSLPPNKIDVARLLIVGIIAGITAADIGILGYTGWNYKLGRVLLMLMYMENH